MKRLILYDLDGTLVDTREDIVRAANFMRAEMGEPPLSASEVSQYVGRGLLALVKGCLKTEDNKKIEQGSKLYRHFYGKHMLDNSRLYPGTLEVLKHFKDRHQAVVTNKPDPFSTDLLKALKIADYFMAIIPGNSAYPKKPEPISTQELMKKSKAAPDETVFIGDSDIDIETARRAGVDAVVILHGFGSENELKSASPKALYKDFEELLAAAKKENW